MSGLFLDAWILTKWRDDNMSIDIGIIGHYFIIIIIILKMKVKNKIKDNQKMKIIHGIQWDAFKM